MQHQSGPSDPDTSTYGPPEVLRAAHPHRAGKHRDGGTVRPTARRGPCADGRRGSPGRPGSASDGGSRGSGCDAEGWAGTCAWSREDSHYRQGRTGAKVLCRPTARNGGAAVGGAPRKRRPPNGTGPRQGGQTARKPAIVPEPLSSRPADTPHDQRLSAIGLHEGLAVASVAVRLTLPLRVVFPGLPRSGLAGPWSPIAPGARRSVAHLCTTVDNDVEGRGGRTRLTHDNPPRGWAAADRPAPERAGRRHRILQWRMSERASRKQG